MLRRHRHFERRPFRKQFVRLHLEELEIRNVLSGPGSSGLPLLAVETNTTLDLAQNLGILDGAGQVQILGNVGDGAEAVNWFQFSLTQAATVDLQTSSLPGSTLDSVISVYNNDPFNFTDPEDVIGHRLLAQATGSPQSGSASFEQSLAAGTYWLAVSGAGDNWSYPFLAGSGYPGSTGAYELTLQSADLPASFDTTPTILYSNPGNGAVVTSSPLVIRLDYSAPLDTNNIDVTATQLIWSPTSNLADPNAQSIALNSCNFSTAANELQLTPASGLEPGYYGVFLADGSIVPALQFQVAGNDTGTTSDDTAATANDLGDLTSAGLVQVAGAIGNDPSYNPNNANPFYANPASQVNLYHFQITGAGRFAFGAEVFAGRIGSALDPGVSLYEWNAATQQLDFIDGNDNTLNPTQSTNGMTPLYTDSMLFAGLTAGDYYVAVSAGGNTPERAIGVLPGQNGVFDPNFTHSGVNGSTVGDYILNLAVQQDNDSPRVVAVTPGDQTTLDVPPTQLTVQFSESMNLQMLAYQAFQQTSQTTIAPVFIEGPDGTEYYPRLESYDDATHQAQFLMLDGLANGTYQLHLSGPLGLTDLAGNPLVGNDPSGDYVTSFTVNGPVAGVGGNPLLQADQEPNDSVLTPQDLGVLFPHELQSGVTITRDFMADPSQAPADTADYYEFQVLQNETYVFTLNGANLPTGVGLSLYDSAGNPAPATIVGGGDAMQAQLAPGKYVVGVTGWTPDVAGSISYQLGIGLGENSDNAPPLVSGAAPALQFRIAGSQPPTSATPQVVVPTTAAESGVVGASFSTGNGDQTGILLPSGVLRQLASIQLGRESSAEVANSNGAIARVAVQLPDTYATIALLTNTITLIRPPSVIGNLGQDQAAEENPLLSLAPAIDVDAETLQAIKVVQGVILDYVFSEWNSRNEQPSRQPPCGITHSPDLLPAWDDVVGNLPALAKNESIGSTAAGSSQPQAAAQSSDSNAVNSHLFKVAACLAIAAGIGPSILSRGWRITRALVIPPQLPERKNSGNANEESSRELFC